MKRARWVPVATALVIALAHSGCGLFSGGASSSSAPDPRKIAVATATALGDAWKASAQSCISYAQEKHDDTVRQKCEAVLTPARNGIIALDSAVDAWTAADQKNYPCLVAAVVRGLGGVQAIVGTAPQVVIDGLKVAQAYAGACSP